MTYNWMQVVELFGGLGLFLYGMHVLSDAVQRRAGKRMRGIMGALTTNRFAGILTGIGATALIQSSSATTVLLVSLVNAGLVNLPQAIGVIMGANIGTTFTGWLVSILGFKFQITAVALPAIAIAIHTRGRRTSDVKVEGEERGGTERHPREGNGRPWATPGGGGRR
ncbi:MAG: Na/Pi symporter, partial [Kiritimatiellia bacterium]